MSKTEVVNGSNLTLEELMLKNTTIKTGFESKNGFLFVFCGINDRYGFFPRSRYYEYPNEDTVFSVLYGQDLMCLTEHPNEVWDALSYFKDLYVRQVKPVNLKFETLEG